MSSSAILISSAICLRSFRALILVTGHSITATACLLSYSSVISALQHGSVHWCGAILCLYVLFLRGLVTCWPLRQVQMCKSSIRHRQQYTSRNLSYFECRVWACFWWLWDHRFLRGRCPIVNLIAICGHLHWLRLLLLIFLHISLL